MTVLEDTLATLNGALPKPVGPIDIGIGDVVEFRGMTLPVIVTSSELDGDVPDLSRAFTWISQALRSNGTAVCEGRSVPEPGEMVLLRARAELVYPDEVRDGDVLLLENRTSLWGLAVGTPRLNGRGLYDIAWRAGWLPTETPATVGWLQREPHQMVRRAPRAGAR